MSRVTQKKCIWRNDELEFENEILHDQVENQNGYINVDQLVQWLEVRTNEVVIELLPKLLEEYAREMNQAKQMQNKEMYA